MGEFEGMREANRVLLGAQSIQFQGQNVASPTCLSSKQEYELIATVLTLFLEIFVNSNKEQPIDITWFLWTLRR
jgi:hypothetical protein